VVLKIVISGEDKRWVCDNHPGLVPTTDGVVGTIQFMATYNDALNRFLSLGAGILDDVGGIKLSCKYQIRIAPRDRVIYSSLPALYVDGVELIEDRHFSRIDSSACLCSPLQESEFLCPALDFRRFFEQLVIPFLYGQSFFSDYGRWPWKDYAHGATGLLESFFDENISDQNEIGNFLSTLALDKSAWPLIREALQRDQVKGHTACFCPKHDVIRRCHPRALAGLRRLHSEVRERLLPFPKP
jgi:hypothetical protein